MFSLVRVVFQVGQKTDLLRRRQDCCSVVYFQMVQQKRVKAMV